MARNEETGLSGVFPVMTVMGRTAPGVLWLTLENAEGKTSRMGVTSEHPLFTVGQGWLNADELVPGDQIRNADLRELTVLSVEIDNTPQRVHNLEIAEAHTYFVGDLEAWGHNGKRAPEKVIGSCPIDEGLDLLSEFLGPDYTDEGNGRYKSADGQRQGRLGSHETRNPNNVHCHLEELRKGRVIFNGVIKLLGK